jgi:hypothetical protein
LFPEAALIQTKLKRRKSIMKKQKIKQLSIRSIFFSSLLTTALFAAGFIPARAQDDNCRDRECRAALVNAKQATAKYHDINAALEDGFVSTGPCVALPTGEAMGFHFTKFSRIDFSVDEAEPEVLLYLPDDDGLMRLVALEYLVPFTGSNPPPVLYGGRMFEGPNTVPFPSYSLHVWAWRHNPWGTFTDFNPKLRCPQPSN